MCHLRARVPNSSASLVFKLYQKYMCLWIAYNKLVIMKLREIEVKPIGFVTQSSYTQKWGTPRQGALTPASNAIITACGKISDLKIGRVGILWHAHLNSSSFNHLKAHIKPPKKLDGPVGVFATRGVHRPSSIGLTFCAITKLENELVITVSGADMIEGTPILRIFSLDAIPRPSDAHMRNPEWTKVKEVKISWSTASFLGVHNSCARESAPKIFELIRTVLTQDPRSVHSLRKHVNPVYEVELKPDVINTSLWLVYRHRSDGSVDVLFVTRERLVQDHRSRTEPWLTRLVDRVPQIRDID